MRATEPESMHRYLIFDMDGVLVNSEPFHKKVLQAALKDLGRSLEDDYYNSLVGMANREMWMKIRDDFKLTTPVDDLMAEHLKLLYVMLEKTDLPVPAGMSQLQTRLRALGVHCSLASSSPPRLIRAVVDGLGIADLLDHMVSGEEVEKSKPEPDIFLKVSAYYGVDPAAFWVIEDSAHGVSAALAAGMRCVGYRNPDSGDQDLSRAHRVISHFDQLNTEELISLWEK